MFRIVGGVLLLLLALPGARAADDPKDKPKKPEEQYQALLKEYNDAFQQFVKAVREAKTPQDQQKVFQEKYPRADKYASKFLELAEKDPKAPFAEDALIWIVGNGGRMVILPPPSGKQKEDVRGKAIALLLRDHVASAKMSQVVQALGYSQDKESAKLLRALLDKSPSKEVRGMACLVLGQALKRNADGLAASDAKAAAKARKESEELLEKAADKYADVKMPFYGTVGKKAKSELFDLHHLSVGKVAPEVKGVDQDGKHFKLSDYRGKVVLLDFWQQF